MLLSIVASTASAAGTVPVGKETFSIVATVYIMLLWAEYGMFKWASKHGLGFFVAIVTVGVTALAAVLVITEGTEFSMFSIFFAVATGIAIFLAIIIAIAVFDERIEFARGVAVIGSVVLIGMVISMWFI